MSNLQRPEPGHSTLEVSQGPHQEDSLKEVVHHDAPEVLFLPELDSYQHDKDRAATQTGRARRRIFCLSYRTFVIVVIAVVVVVGAIVGGVVGGIVGSRGGTPSPSSTPTPTATPGSYLLSDSKLAASNYTDANGNVHRSVFFQDTTNALIARLWDSQNNTWRTLNITQQLPGANVQSGTPLTSSSLDLDSQRIHMWCLLADQSIHGYYWNGQGGDPLEAQWAEETSIDRSRRFAKTGSSLASAWQRPLNANSSDIGSWILVFQKQSGEIAVTNYTGSETVAINANAVASLTSLAMTPELTDGILSRLTLTYESNGKILKVSYTEGEWDADAVEHTPIFSDLSAPSSTVKLATTAFDLWHQILFLALLPNGTVSANWYDNGFKPLSSIGLSGGPRANFSAIATTSDARFYGIFNDSILEYSIDTSNPRTFNYVGVVFP